MSQQQYCFSFNISSILQIFFSFSPCELFPVCQEHLETEDVLLPLGYQCKSPNQINRQQMCHPKVRTLQKTCRQGALRVLLQISSISRQLFPLNPDKALDFIYSVIDLLIYLFSFPSPLALSTLCQDTRTIEANTQIAIKARADTHTHTGRPSL